MCGDWLLKLILKPFIGGTEKLNEIDYPEIWEEFKDAETA